MFKMISKFTDMNRIDDGLVKLLRRNARESIANLAINLKVSRATIRHHMLKLERSGQIVGYTVKLRDDDAPKGVKALTMIAIEGHKTAKIISDIYGVPSVETVHTTNGKWDLVVELTSDDLVELDAALTKIRKIEGITASETNILLTTMSASKLSH